MALGKPKSGGNQGKICECESVAIASSGGAAIVRGGGAVRLLDNFVGQVTTAAAYEFAAHRAIGGLAVTAPAAGGGANVAIANHIAGADDHGADVALLRRVRK